MAEENKSKLNDLLGLVANTLGGKLFTIGTNGYEIKLTDPIRKVSTAILFLREEKDEKKITNLSFRQSLFNKNGYGNSITFRELEKIYLSVSPGSEVAFLFSDEKRFTVVNLYKNGLVDVINGPERRKKEEESLQDQAKNIYEEINRKKAGIFKQTKNIYYHIKESNVLKFTLDGDFTEIPKDNFSNFEEFYKIVSEELENSKRVIAEIIVNDEVMTEGKQFTLFKQDFSAINSVEITTKEKDAMVKENIAGFKEQCDLILSNIDKTVEAYRTGEEVESHNYFANIIEGIRWFNYALELLVSFLRIDAKVFRIEDRSINESVESLSEIINSLAESQDSEDWIMLADQLEYELKPEIEFWKANIDKINE